MSSNPEEKALQYLNQQLRKCRLSDFEELAPLYFNCTFSFLSGELLKMKLPVTKFNLTKLLFDSIKEVGWTRNKVLTVAATLSIENMIRMKSGQGPPWQAQRMFCSNSDIIETEQEKTLFKALERAIKSRQEDARILAKRSNGLIWLAVLYKDLTDKIFEMPIFLVISTDYQYMFSRKALPLRLSEAVKLATKCRKIQSLHLTGRHVGSLLALLQGRNVMNAPRPMFQPQTPKLNDSGCDFTHGTEIKHYAKQCLGNSIQLEQYSVEPANKRWKGDETPELRLIDIKSEVLFSGDVSAIFAVLPAASICTPPFPDYIRDFTILGRTRVSSEL